MHELGGWPDADMLERVAPGRPVALVRARPSRALGQSRGDARWPRSTDLEATRRRRSSAATMSGRPTGILHEARRRARRIRSSRIRRATCSSSGCNRSRSSSRPSGMTGCHDPGELNADTSMKRGPLFYRDLAEEGKLPLRVHGLDSLAAARPSASRSAGAAASRVGRYTIGLAEAVRRRLPRFAQRGAARAVSRRGRNPPTGGPRGMVITDADGAARACSGSGRRPASRARSTPSAMRPCARRSTFSSALPRKSIRRSCDGLSTRSSSIRRTNRGSARWALPRRFSPSPAQRRRAGARGVGRSGEDSFPLRACSRRRAHPVRHGRAGRAGRPVAGDRRCSVPPGPVRSGRRARWLRPRHQRRARNPRGMRRSGARRRPARSGPALPGYIADLIVVPSVVADDEPDPASLASVRPLAAFLDGELIFGEI